MSTFSYVALNSTGHEVSGLLESADQAEALQRIKQMGCFPTQVRAVRRVQEGLNVHARSVSRVRNTRWMAPRISQRVLSTFTRQLATLIEAGLPLTRGLRLLHEEEKEGVLRDVIARLILAIEGGQTLSEAMAAEPRVFNNLYVNMVRAGEIGGVLDVTFRRLSEFIDKSLRIRGKVVAGMFYPVSVLVVATGIIALLVLFIVPRFRVVFAGLTDGKPLPAFTEFILGISVAAKQHFWVPLILLAAVVIGWQLLRRSERGRLLIDRLKLKVPAFGPVLAKAALGRFARTLGTLLGSGVPVLQALTIVKQTTGNALFGNAVGQVYESVKQGESIKAPLKASGIFPALMIGMVDVGEQTGSLPDMLLKVADDYDEQVDNAVTAMTSLIEPVLIVFLALVVGSIVIALFLPLISLMDDMNTDRAE